MNEHPTPISGILTSEETTAIELAQDGFSAQAKLALGGLCETLGIAEEHRAIAASNLGEQLQGLDFMQRREVATGLLDVNRALARSAIHAVSSDRIVASSDQQTMKNVGETSDNGLMAGDTNSKKELIDTPDLTSIQRTWLSGVFSETQLEAISEMNSQQREVMTENLAKLYSTLKIPRITAAGKAARVEQLKLLMAGKSYAEIQEMTDSVSKPALTQGMRKMSYGIAKRTSERQLQKIIDVASESSVVIVEDDFTEIESPQKDTDVAAEREVEEAEQLAEEQAKWLHRVMPNVDSLHTSELTQKDRVELCGAIAETYSRIKAKKLSTVKLGIAIEQIELFITFSKPYEYISERYNRPLDRIKHEFYDIGEALKQSGTEEEHTKIQNIIERCQTKH